MYSLRDPAGPCGDAVKQLGTFFWRSYRSDSTADPSDEIEVKDWKTGALSRPVREVCLATAWSTGDVDATKQPALGLYRPPFRSATEATTTAAP